jgi:tetratricopeptide (TPR) repeat protein
MKHVLIAAILLAFAGASVLASEAGDLVTAGRSALLAKDAVKAMASFTAALEKEPRNAAAAYERGKLLVFMGRPQLAIADFTTAVLSDPHLGKAFAGRANAKLSLKDTKGAATDFDEAVNAAPKDYEVYVERAIFFLKIGSVPEARTDLRQAASLTDAEAARKIRAMLEVLEKAP